MTTINPLRARQKAQSSRMIAASQACRWTFYAHVQVSAQASSKQTETNYKANSHTVKYHANTDCVNISAYRLLTVQDPSIQHCVKLKTIGGHLMADFCNAPLELTDLRHRVNSANRSASHQQHKQSRFSCLIHLWLYILRSYSASASLQ